MPAPPSSFRPIGALLALMLMALAGCATPVFKDAPPTAPMPSEVASAPERYHGADVVWGGSILSVHNLADTTEVEIVAYPLDRAQRPDQGAPTQGRFIVVLPGYAESMDYPAGRFLTVRGHLEGTRSGHVEDRDYVYPLLEREALHVWPVNFPYERGRVSFSIGLGLGIR